MGDYLDILDTTPRAKATNNITAKRVPVDTIYKLIDESHKQGVEPTASLAAAWKETGFGTNRGWVKSTDTGKMVPRIPADEIWRNPMQYNAQDLAPKGKETDPYTLKEQSREAFNKKIDTRILNHPKFAELDNESSRLNNWFNTKFPGSTLDLSSVDVNDPEIKTYQEDRDFNNARIGHLAKQISRDTHIEGGVGYLKKMMNKNSGALQSSFADYRGTGQKAVYHGKHLMELYNSLKNNSEIQNMIKERKK